MRCISQIILHEMVEDEMLHVVQSVFKKFVSNFGTEPNFIELGYECLDSKTKKIIDDTLEIKWKSGKYRHRSELFIDLRFNCGNVKLKIVPGNYIEAIGGNRLTEDKIITIKPQWDLEQLWKDDEGIEIIVRTANNCDMVAFRPTQNEVDWTVKSRAELMAFGFEPAFGSKRAVNESSG